MLNTFRHNMFELCAFGFEETVLPSDGFHI